MDQTLYKLPNKPTNAGGFQWHALVTGAFLLLLANIIATQYIALKLGYQEALGTPVLIIAGTPFYQPLSWFVWVIKYSRLDIPAVNFAIQRGMTISLIGNGVAVFTALAVRFWQTRRLQKGAEDLHGSARWATRKDIEKASLLGSNQGVYVGGWLDPDNKRLHYLRHNGPQHVMAIAPTRSGKGVSLILPTLLAWPESVVVYDMKGENYALTAGWRETEANTRTLRFSPVEIGKGVRYNPLNEIRWNTERDVSDAQTVAQMVCISGEKADANDHWVASATSLITAAILHAGYLALQEGKHASLQDVSGVLSTPGQAIRETLEQMLLEEHDPTSKNAWISHARTKTTTHPVVAKKAQEMLDKEDKELSGVLSTATTKLALFDDPIIARNTAGSDFQISDLMNADRPISLYLVVPPSDQIRLTPLIRLIFTQIMARLTEHMEFADGRSVKHYKHRLLMMMDEFPTLGKLDIFGNALAYCAGYGIKCYLIIQDRPQLLERYGENESITSNCHIRTAFAPNNLGTAEWLSSMTGTMTVTKQSFSYSGNRMAPVLGQVSTNIDQVERPLLTPDECMRLPGAETTAEGDVLAPGDMLVFSAGFAPIFAKQMLYFLDPEFLRRARIASPIHAPPIIEAPPAPSAASAGYDALALDITSADPEPDHEDHELQDDTETTDEPHLEGEA